MRPGEGNERGRPPPASGRWLEEAEELVQGHVRGAGEAASPGVLSARRALFGTPKRATSPAHAALASAEELLSMHARAYAQPRGGGSPSRPVEREAAAGDVIDRAEALLKEAREVERSNSAAPRAATVRVKRSLLVRADEAELSRRHLARLCRVVQHADGHPRTDSLEAGCAPDHSSVGLSADGSRQSGDSLVHGAAEHEQLWRSRRQQRARALMLRTQLLRALQGWRQQAGGAKQAVHMEEHVLQEATVILAAAAERDAERDAANCEAADGLRHASLARFALALFSTVIAAARELDGLTARFRVARERKAAWRWWLRAFAAFRVDCESQARAAQRKKKLDALVKGLSTAPRLLRAAAAPQLADAAGNQQPSRSGARSVSAAHSLRAPPCPPPRAPTPDAELGASNAGAASSAAPAVGMPLALPCTQIAPDSKDGAMDASAAQPATSQRAHAQEGAATANIGEYDGPGHGDARQSPRAGRQADAAGCAATGSASCSARDIAPRQTARTQLRATGHNGRLRTASLSARSASPRIDEAKRCQEVRGGDAKAFEAMLERQMMRSVRRQALHVSFMLFPSPPLPPALHCALAASLGQAGVPARRLETRFSEVGGDAGTVCRAGAPAQGSRAPEGAGSCGARKGAESGACTRAEAAATCGAAASS